jgi:sporulation protein YlmC with PRC-barrel domain
MSDHHSVGGGSDERGHGLDANLHLMDRQIVDNDGRMVAKVDDVELEEQADGRIVVTALLTGPGALGPRLGGATGFVTTNTWSRLAGRAGKDPKRIDIGDVSDIATAITLHVSRRTADVDGFELWVRDRLIAAFPGQGEDPE